MTGPRHGGLVSAGRGGRQGASALRTISSTVVLALTGALCVLRGPSSPAEQQTVRYGYDDASRLTSVVYRGGSGSGRNNTQFQKASTLTGNCNVTTSNCLERLGRTKGPIVPV